MCYYYCWLDRYVLINVIVIDIIYCESLSYVHSFFLIVVLFPPSLVSLLPIGEAIYVLVSWVCRHGLCFFLLLLVFFYALKFLLLH
jgi:hypothetical protein